MNLDKFKTVEQLAAAIKSLDMVTSVAWTDYSGTSTITGWTSYTTKEIWYKKIGKLVFVTYHIDGTSNDTSTNFTLPFTNTNDLISHHVYRGWNDGGAASAWQARLPNNSSTISFFASMASTAWIASGNKAIMGGFWYQTT